MYKITSSASAEVAFRQIFDADLINWREEFILLCLNNSNKVLGFYKVSSGGMTGTVADVRMIYTLAINALSTGIIVAHNHPSGTLEPSKADRDLTKTLARAGEILSIRLLDHIIITEESYYSFADNGLI